MILRIQQIASCGSQIRMVNGKGNIHHYIALGGLILYCDRRIPRR